MEKRIQDLTEKLYKEGVEKGNAQADVIITEANNNAKNIIEQANKDAEQIIALAKKQNEDLKQNTINELKLYAGQTVEAVKTSLTDCITNSIVEKVVKEVLDDKKYMQELILRLVAEWSKKEDLVIECEDAQSLTTYFTTKAKDLLDKGVKIEEVNGYKHSFSVKPADGSYKIVFGESEFEELFKDFLRPALVELLYK